MNKSVTTYAVQYQILKSKRHVSYVWHNLDIYDTLRGARAAIRSERRMRPDDKYRIIEIHKTFKVIE